MRPRIQLACMACNAVAQCLIRLGIPTGITAFPGQPDKSNHPTVVPVLHPGQTRQPAFSVEVRGNTPLTESLWWVLQRLAAVPQSRKIVLLITDGIPNDLLTAQQVVAAGQSAGMEIYALGIDSAQVADLYPTNFTTITQLAELPAALFALLETALLAQRSTTPC